MRNVFFLGLVSFFSDISADMVYPLIPLYLTTTLGVTPALVGVIEGIAESVASLLKVFSGYLTDRFQKKKLLAFLGYAPGIFYKLILVLAGSWVGVLCARVFDRVGKGIRVAPRDVLVSESADKNAMGKAFGLHKALDMLGAALGVLLTYFLMRSMLGAPSGFDFKKVFLLSLIPAALGLAMFLFVKEKKTPRPAKTPEFFWKNIHKVDRQLWLYLVVVFLFTLGNSSNTFILLKAQDAGFDAVNVILLFFIYHLAAGVLSLPFGALSDRIGRKRLLIPGYLAFSLCYLGFAFITSPQLMVVAFIVYGAYTAMITGVERAFVAEISPPDLKGTMLGLQSTVAGVALLPASVIAGLLWDGFGSTTPFIFGAILSLFSVILLAVFMKRHHDR
ncbi:MAG: MFS transporter [Coriobacteriia bacterium]|nr:MFS transporter [Coriobacteriia bacterium]